MLLGISSVMLLELSGISTISVRCTLLPTGDVHPRNGKPATATLWFPSFELDSVMLSLDDITNIFRTQARHHLVCNMVWRFEGEQITHHLDDIQTSDSWTSSPVLCMYIVMVVWLCIGWSTIVIKTLKYHILNSDDFLWNELKPFFSCLWQWHEHYTIESFIFFSWLHSSVISNTS